MFIYGTTLRKTNLAEIFSEARSGTIAHKNKKRITAVTQYGNRFFLPAGKFARIFLLVLFIWREPRAKSGQKKKMVRAKSGQKKRWCGQKAGKKKVFVILE